MGWVGQGKGKPEVASRSGCESFRDAIVLGLSRGRNARAIWQDLVSDYNFDRGYQSVRGFVYKLRGAEVPQAKAVILTVPGEEAQVDYGTGRLLRDPESGKYRRAENCHFFSRLGT